MMNYDVKKMEWGQTLELPSSRALRHTAHVIGGRYPCRSVAFIPRILLTPFKDQEGTKVLDPFMGSGTTAVEAIYNGLHPYGLEVDPFARLISEVSTHGFTVNEKSEIAEVNHQIEVSFHNTVGNICLSPKTKNIEYWFEDVNFNDLLKLKTLIFKHTKSEHVHRFFLTVLADIIRASSKAERQSLKPYISKKYEKKRNDVLTVYKKSYSNYFKAIHFANDRFADVTINWLKGDATNFDLEESIDIAISSPPYINAMEYVRCIKLESAWIDTGTDAIFTDVRKKQLGEQARVKESNIEDVVRECTTPSLGYLLEVDPARFATAMTYFQDMFNNLKCVNKALKKGATYHVIIGNSVIRQREVATHKIIAELAKLVGFKWESYFNYPIKDHRTSLPRNGKGGKIAMEHVISLRKL
ncbi:hypothetical protein RJ44_19890 [Alteromonas macleodii]|uniref:DNA methyltransferase n=1 Tax=Alteromonas macleodii TaxID=28108 RepID=UPI00057DC6DC|nr:DNA methyltransferase [Alteromonas macleodii]KHT53262.1 hypothetical protein RJ44_19890 [Alteromonas macleodii]